MTLCVVFLAQLVILINVTIVTVAFIQRDLSFSPGDLTWVVNIYALVLGGFIMFGGRSSDIFGGKQVFITGKSLFAAGSLVSGGARHSESLLTGYVIQGLGAASTVPIILSILTMSFADGPERRRAFAVWGGVNSVAIGATLVLGGILVKAFLMGGDILVNVALGVVL